jgi:hypothetical protein
MAVLFICRENQNKYVQLKGNKRLASDSNGKGGEEEEDEEEEEDRFKHLRKI